MVAAAQAVTVGWRVTGLVTLGLSTMREVWTAASARVAQTSRAMSCESGSQA
jgi:hypothetical protein